MRDIKPLVSVVIPTYSRNDTLKIAIDTVLAQTYSNMEIIVVDDNPEESEYRKSTSELMKNYVNKPNIYYLQNEKNLGGAGARNEGIKAAHGEYIAFLDDDDEYFPEKIEKQMQMFLKVNNENLALVFCDSVMTHDNDKFVCYVRPRYTGCCIYEAMRDNCLAATSQWLVRKDILEEVGLFTVVPCKQDSQLILKILAAGYEVAGVPEVLSKYCNYKGKRISGIGTKNLQGELLYREACRKQYFRLTFEQIEEVEFSFAKKLYVIYRGLRREHEWKNELETMWKIHSLKTLNFLLHDLYYRIHK